MTDVRVKWDHDPDTGILEVTLYQGEVVVLNETVTDPEKVAEIRKQLGTSDIPTCTSIEWGIMGGIPRAVLNALRLRRVYFGYHP